MCSGCVAAACAWLLFRVCVGVMLSAGCCLLFAAWMRVNDGCAAIYIYIYIYIYIKAIEKRLKMRRVRRTLHP